MIHFIHDIYNDTVILLGYNINVGIYTKQHKYAMYEIYFED